jgi:hypothetical protein
MEYLKYLIEHINSVPVLWGIIIILLFANILLFALYKTKSKTLQLAETTINIVFAKWHFKQSEDELVKETILENQLLKEELDKVKSKNSRLVGQTFGLLLVLFIVLIWRQLQELFKGNKRKLNESKKQETIKGLLENHPANESPQTTQKLE